jgi:hypothetical protein
MTETPGWIPWYVPKKFPFNRASIKSGARRNHNCSSIVRPVPRSTARGINARKKMIAGIIQNDSGFSRNLFKMEEIVSFGVEISHCMRKRSTTSER